MHLQYCTIFIFKKPHRSAPVWFKPMLFKSQVFVDVDICKYAHTHTPLIGSVPAFLKNLDWYSTSLSLWALPNIHLTPVRFLMYWSSLLWLISVPLMFSLPLLSSLSFIVNQYNHSLEYIYFQLPCALFSYSY